VARLWLFVVLLGVLVAWPLVVVALLADLLQAGLYRLAPSLRPEAA
jgi:hypothetical protein